jgi:predicted transcriptional regulator
MAMPRASAKEKALAAIRELPEDSTIEDVIERLAFVQAVEEGFRQSEAGQVTAQEEIERQFLK